MSKLTKEGFLGLCLHDRFVFAGDLLHKYNKEKNTHVPIARMFMWIQQLENEGCLVTQAVQYRLQVKVTEEGIRALERYRLAAKNATPAESSP